MSADSTDTGDRTVPELVGRLGGQVSELVGKEMALARAELREELSKGVTATASLSGAALAALFGSLFLSSAAAWGLSEVMAPGFAFLIVGGAYMLVAGVLALVGRRKLAAVDPVPHETLDSLKEDAQWATNRKS